jgi:hypothetical protein
MERERNKKCHQIIQVHPIKTAFMPQKNTQRGETTPMSRQTQRKRHLPNEML